MVCPTAFCLCSDGSWPLWPWSEGQPVITSAPRELVRRCLVGTSLDRALAISEFTPEQRTQLFRGRSNTLRFGGLARVGRRVLELELVGFLREQEHVDERSLVSWLQGAPRGGTIEERRREFFRRFMRGPPGRSRVSADA